MNFDELKYFIEKKLSKPPFEGNFPAVGKYGFPQLAQTNFIPEKPVLPINYLNQPKIREIIGFIVSRAIKIFIESIVHFKIMLDFLNRQKE